MRQHECMRIANILTTHLIGNSTYQKFAFTQIGSPRHARIEFMQFSRPFFAMNDFLVKKILFLCLHFRTLSVSITNDAEWQ